MANRNMRPGRTAGSAPRAITLGLLSLLTAACVRHLPVVGETEGQASSSKAGASGRVSGSAGASARRAASEPSAAAAGSRSEEEEEQPAAPAAGKSGSKPAVSGSARAAAGSGTPADSPEKAGSGASEPVSARAGSGAAPSGMSAAGAPSTPAESATPGGGWYCAQANDVCSCVEASGVSGDTCTSHPTCCFEVTNGTTYRSCLCVPEGSAECTGYTTTPAQQVKKISSCPF